MRSTAPRATTSGSSSRRTCCCRAASRTSLERLEAEAPDVLFVHHTRVDARGRVHEGSGRGPSHAWSKLLRRDHLRALAVRFAPGAHGELPVTWPAMLAAEKVAPAPHAGYVHIRPDGGDGSPFDVFAAYDAVFAAVPKEARPRWRRRCASTSSRSSSAYPSATGASSSGRCRRAGVATAAAMSRLPPAGSAACGARSWSGTRTARSGSSSARAGRRGRALPSDDGAAASANSGSTGTTSRGCVNPSIPSSPSSPPTGSAATPATRARSTRRRASSSRTCAASGSSSPARPATLPPGVDHVVAGTPEYFDVVARARYFVNNVNFPNHLVKREGTIHVMTHHGTPLKQMGLDLRDTPIAGRRMDFDALLRRVDAVGLQRLPERVLDARSGSASTRGRTSRSRSATRATTCSPRATEEDVQRVRARARDRARPDRRPLHADAPRVPERTTCPCSTSRSSPTRSARTTWCWPGCTTSTMPTRTCASSTAPGRIRDVASHPSIEELCLAADVLVTDYSSIMFDYAVLDRPIVIHAPDWEVYRAMRGTYFDLMAEPPGRGRAHRGRAGRGAALALGVAARRRAVCAPRSARASARSTTAAPPSASCAGLARARAVGPASLEAR